MLIFTCSNNINSNNYNLNSNNNMANNGNTIIVPAGKKKRRRKRELKETLKNIHKFINFQGFESQLDPLIDTLMPHTAFHCSLSQ